MNRKRNLNNDTAPLMGFNISILKFLSLWPRQQSVQMKSNNFKLYNILLQLTVLPALIPVIIDMILQLQEMDELIGLTENIVAICACCGMFFMAGCFMYKYDEMKLLVANLQRFNKYGTRDFIRDTTEKVKFYTKFFLFYSILGNFMYASIPMYQKQQCLHAMDVANKTGRYLVCGVITRTRFPNVNLDVSPRYELVALSQIWTCFFVSTVVLMITMFLCSLLMYLVAEIKNLHSMFLEITSTFTVQNVVDKLRVCIEYHVAIIEYSDRMRDAFGGMLMSHLSLTSLSLSVLGYEIVMVKTIADSLRFGLHLGGWLFILLLTCYFGQQLINESTNIGWAVYCIPWHELEVKQRKDIKFILTRSQRPLVLTASIMGVMSLETFLRVLSSAYSYFTLLLNFN